MKKSRSTGEMLDGALVRALHCGGHLPDPAFASGREPDKPQPLVMFRLRAADEPAYMEARNHFRDAGSLQSDFDSERVLIHLAERLDRREQVVLHWRDIDFARFLQRTKNMELMQATNEKARPCLGKGLSVGRTRGSKPMCRLPRRSKLKANDTSAHQHITTDA
jgi:hypothetical protein